MIYSLARIQEDPMKRFLALVLASLSLLAFVLPVAAEPGTASKGALGLLFNAKSVLTVDGFEDGYQAGAGLKYWATPEIAARVLLGVEHNTNVAGTDSTTTFGLGLAGEYHFATGPISPYAGALLGMRLLAVTGDETLGDYYFGALGGAEIKISGPVSAFFEYQLLASFDANGFSLNLGTNGTGAGSALIGLIVYL
jgi:hypothetical protein